MLLGLCMLSGLLGEEEDKGRLQGCNATAHSNTVLGVGNWFAARRMYVLTRQ